MGMCGACFAPQHGTWQNQLLFSTGYSDLLRLGWMRSGEVYLLIDQQLGDIYQLRKK